MVQRRQSAGESGETRTGFVVPREGNLSVSVPNRPALPYNPHRLSKRRAYRNAYSNNVVLFHGEADSSKSVLQTRMRGIGG